MITLRLNTNWSKVHMVLLFLIVVNSKAMALQKNAEILFPLFPSGVLGMFFDATIRFYTSQAMTTISSLVDSELRVPVESTKADFVGSEIRLRITPQIEELMLIYVTGLARVDILKDSGETGATGP